MTPNATDLATYCALDAQIDAIERAIAPESLRYRWEFGRALLAERVGKKLPNGRLEEIAAAIGKSVRELKYRMQFASRCNSEIKLGNAVAQYSSWHAVVDSFGREARRRAERDRTARPADWPDDLTDACELICAPIAEANVAPESVHWIITDPPYPKAFLPVYSDLGAFADRVLVDGGSLLAMIGQSYLPEIIARLSDSGLRYQWTLAYLTPGGQAVQLWDRKVNTFWKPLLWFVKGEYRGQWVGDVCKSAPNDNDKRFHEWGQSESGLADIVTRFTEPGDLICDPFLGGGSTAMVALGMHRRFIGVDIDATAIETVRRRLVA